MLSFGFALWMESWSQTQGLVLTNWLSKRGGTRVGSCQEGRDEQGFCEDAPVQGGAGTTPGVSTSLNVAPEVPPLPHPGLSPSSLLI